MSAESGSSSPLPELPPEIWLKIFRIATFIPHETELPAATFEQGFFCSHDQLQILAFEAVLPLRRTIIHVSRRFYQIGAEVLYTTFHANTGVLKYPNRRLSRFSDLLVSRPELGRFVKRLSLQWSDENEEKNYRIISRCPHVTIFSSFLPITGIGDVPWWRRGLPKTIRCFDAVVLSVPMKDVMALLEMLPHLEMLLLYNLQGDSILHPPVRLSALRFLGVYAQNNEWYPPLLSTMRLPRLVALATNLGGVDAGLSLPLEVWRRLVHFEPSLRFYNGLRADYFHNLRSLYLTVEPDSEINNELHLRCFPFGQIEHLTLRICPFFLAFTNWDKIIERVTVLPLDVETMPKLKLFQLAWGFKGIHVEHYKYPSCVVGKDRFIQCLETAVTNFEQRGVLSVEIDTQEICPGYQPVRDALTACKLS